MSNQHAPLPGRGRTSIMSGPKSHSAAVDSRPGTAPRSASGHSCGRTAHARCPRSAGTGPALRRTLDHQAAVVVGSDVASVRVPRVWRFSVGPSKRCHGHAGRPGPTKSWADSTIRGLVDREPVGASPSVRHVHQSQPAPGTGRIMPTSLLMNDDTSPVAAPRLVLGPLRPVERRRRRWPSSRSVTGPTSARAADLTCLGALSLVRRSGPLAALPSGVGCARAGSGSRSLARDPAGPAPTATRLLFDDAQLRWRSRHTSRPSRAKLAERRPLRSSLARGRRVQAGGGTSAGPSRRTGLVLRSRSSRRDLSQRSGPGDAARGRAP